MHFLIAVFKGIGYRYGDAVFKVIGYLYGDAGLQDLLIDYGVYAANSVNQMLAGKNLGRMFCAIKLVVEVFGKRFLINLSI